jgi:hypothetical protein
MSTTRQITLTENPDGKWMAYDTATEHLSKGAIPDEALDNLDDAALASASPTDHVGGYGLFAGSDRDGKAFAAAVEQSRVEFDADYEDKQDDLFGQ